MIVGCLHVSNIIIQIVSLAGSVGSGFLESCLSEWMGMRTVWKNLLRLHNISHLEQRIENGSIAAMAQGWRERVVLCGRRRVGMGGKGGDEVEWNGV